MLKLKIIFMSSIIGMKALAGVILTKGEQINCKPSEYYSGGFDMYEVVVSNFFNESVYQGRHYFQRTSGHGLIIGKSVLKDTVILNSTIQNGVIQLDGFKSSFNKIDSIRFPQVWTGETIEVESSLFNNDLLSTGECRRQTVNLLRVEGEGYKNLENSEYVDAKEIVKELAKKECNSQVHQVSPWMEERIRTGWLYWRLRATAHFQCDNRIPNEFSLK